VKTGQEKVDRNITIDIDLRLYLFVSTTKDCVSTPTVIAIPESKKAVKFRSGWGTAELSVVLNNGMVASAGQKTDTKIPETLAAVAALGTAGGGLLKGTREIEKTVCTPAAVLYPIISGVPDTTHPIPFKVESE
jgi:hypothetical protein